MDFSASKTPTKVIKEGAFGGTYFIDTHSSVNGRWYRKSWEEFNDLKNVDIEYDGSDDYDLSVNKYGVRCITSLRFCKLMPVF